MDIKKNIDIGFSNTSDDIAGPGHKPVVPHPMPNKHEPMINFLSIFIFVGN